MPVYKTISKNMDYDEFCERFMEQRTLHPYTETDEAFENRCREAWSNLVRAQLNKGYTEFKQGNEEDEGEEELDYEIDEFIRKTIETYEDTRYSKLVEENIHQTQMSVIKQMMMKELPETKEDLKSNYEHCQAILRLVNAAMEFRVKYKWTATDLDEIKKKVSEDKDRFARCLWAIERGYQVGLVAKVE